MFSASAVLTTCPLGVCVFLRNEICVMKTVRSSGQTAVRRTGSVCREPWWFAVASGAKAKFEFGENTCIGGHGVQGETAP